MKKIHLFIVTLIIFSLCTLFVACEKDEEIDLTTISVSKEQFTPSYTSAALQCSFATKATLRNVYVQYATTQDFIEYDEMEMSKSDDVYSVVLDSLQDNTTYYVRYAVSNRYSSAMIEEISTFQTLQPSVPTIALKSISDIWDTHAKAEIALEFDGGSQISEMGICWNTQTAPIVENNKLTIKDTIAVLEIKDLQPNTHYFVRAYAINKVGVAYSEEFEFTTFSLPEIRTEDITDIHSTIAMLHGTLVFNGNDTATIKGFCWSTNDEPTLENSYVEIDTTSATYTYRLSNLIDETQYYVRAYAQNKIGIVYGKLKSFTTQSAAMPTVTTSSVTYISYTSATVRGNVNSDGGATVTEHGVVYSTTQNPTTSNSKVSNGSGTGPFTCSLNNLQDGTTYYVRAYAVNKKGTSYGEQKSFTTTAYALPTVATSAVTNITYTSATVGGNVTSDGGATVTERGVVYSTSQNPTTSNSKVTSGSGTGSFTCSLSNLQEGTTYYIRAYAINQEGTAYGEQKSYITNGTKNNNGFSVSSSKKIVFSPGNLQYTQSTDTWSFAENQWDYIGTDNVTGGSVSSNQYGDRKYGDALADKIDLFGWSTSATNFGVSTSIDDADYSGSFVDWGTNKIGNDAPNTWRTLTNDEWYYLRKNRTNANDLVGVAQVNGVNGLIFLPDNWTCPSGVTFKSGFHSSYISVDHYAAYQTFTADQWSKLEASGAVFLPAAGSRDGSIVGSVQNYGYYWSATEHDSNSAVCFYFRSDGAFVFYNIRNYGRSVRLVKDL